jgi:hypothetical protein
MSDTLTRLEALRLVLGMALEYSDSSLCGEAVILAQKKQRVTSDIVTAGQAIQGQAIVVILALLKEVEEASENPEAVKKHLADLLDLYVSQ